jgi:hypothetical protein
MNIEYSHPAGFIGDSTIVYCSSDVCIVGGLAAIDRSFAVFYRIQNPFTVEDSIYYKSLNQQFTSPVVDVQHISLVNDIVKSSFGNNANWKDYVRYHSSEFAKSEFNADTVLSVSVPIEKYDGNLLNGKFVVNNDYSHVTILILQKEGRGFVAMYLLYNEGNTNLETYMPAIEETLKYREGEPEMKKLDGFHDSIYIRYGRAPRAPITR